MRKAETKREARTTMVGKYFKIASRVDTNDASPYAVMQVNCQGLYNPLCSDSGPTGAAKLEPPQGSLA